MAWSALLGNGLMTATAMAMTDVQAIAISGHRVQAACAGDSELCCQLMRGMASALAQRLLATRLQLLDLFADSASRTYADQDRA